MWLIKGSQELENDFNHKMSAKTSYTHSDSISEDLKQMCLCTRVCAKLRFNCNLDMALGDKPAYGSLDILEKKKKKLRHEYCGM